MESEPLAKDGNSPARGACSSWQDVDRRSEPLLACD